MRSQTRSFPRTTSWPACSDPPDRTSCGSRTSSGITQHLTGEACAYCAGGIDEFSRLVVGHAIADHLRIELVIVTFEVASWRRRPAPCRIFHSDHGMQYVSWAFGRRLREAGLLASMGGVGDALDNTVGKAFSASMQTEIFDRRKA